VGLEPTHHPDSGDASPRFQGPLREVCSPQEPRHRFLLSTHVPSVKR
jgi:hypothetical protein